MLEVVLALLLVVEVILNEVEEAAVVEEVEIGGRTALRSISPER